MRARLFTENDAAAWDEFVRECHSATFLHSRLYLSYHGERFHDLSMILEDKDRWIGVFPAARHPRNDACVVSHAGITYGGMLHKGDLRGEQMVAALESIRRWYAESGFKRLVYKAVPHIYHRIPAQDDLYALFRLGATRTVCGLSSAIDLSRRAPSSERRRRCLKKAMKSGVRIGAGIEYADALWEVVGENLMRRHNVLPVHSLDEIRLLAERFPDNIRFLAGTCGGRVEAGVVLFITATAYHAQYTAASPAGYRASALDAVFDHAISEALSRGARWFDFGISTEDEGRVLNTGLYDFKSEFGGGGIVHEMYELALD